MSDGPQLRVAFCGLGRMGAEMVAALTERGFPVTVWNRTPDKAAALAAATGAERQPSPPESASSAADVVITMLTDGDAVLATLGAADGVLAGARKGTVVVDCSTIGAEAARQAAALCAKSEVGFLDSPVSGSTVVARQGKLGLMVGGDSAVIDQARPVLDALGHGRARRPDRRRSRDEGGRQRVAAHVQHRVGRVHGRGSHRRSVRGRALRRPRRRRPLEPVPRLQAAILQRPGEHCGRVRPANRDQGPRPGGRCQRRMRDCPPRSWAALSNCTSRRSRTASAIATWRPWLRGSASGLEPTTTQRWWGLLLPVANPKGADVGIHTYGTNAVDWEQRLDFDRLRTERLARLRAELERSSLGAVLAFDFTNIRYMTATHIGTWAVDKLIRFSLLARGGRADHLGLRVCGTPPPALQPVAQPRRIGVPGRRPRTPPRCVGPGDRRARRHLHPAGCLPPGRRYRRGGRAQDQGRAREARPARTSHSGSTSSSCRSWPPCRPLASRWSTASRCSSRRAGSRRRTRSAC